VKLDEELEKLGNDLGGVLSSLWGKDVGPYAKGQIERVRRRILDLACEERAKAAVVDSFRAEIARLKEADPAGKLAALEALRKPKP
jgi:hypothetical protein